MKDLFDNDFWGFTTGFVVVVIFAIASVVITLLQQGTISGS